jgi:hypothetical protein
LFRIIEILIAHLHNQPVTGNPGVVYQNAYSSVFGSQRLEYLGQLGCIGNIHAMGLAAKACLLYHILKLAKLLGIYIQSCYCASLF